MNYEDNPWWYENNPFYLTEKFQNLEGFVYLITNIQNNKQYIGKKSFWQRRKIKSTGRRKTSESNWKNYYSSSDELNKDVKLLGENNFKREIIHLCTHKKVMSYFETKEQFDRNVLLSENFYNMCIAGKYYLKDGKIVSHSMHLTQMNKERNINGESKTS